MKLVRKCYLQFNARPLPRDTQRYYRRPGREASSLWATYLIFCLKDPKDSFAASTMILRYYYLIHAVLLLFAAFQFSPVQCIGGSKLRHYCQKSGCRSDDGDGSAGSKPNVQEPPAAQVKFKYDTPDAGEKPKRRNYFLVFEWIMIFVLLRFLLYIKYHPWVVQSMREFLTPAIKRIKYYIRAVLRKRTKAKVPRSQLRGNSFSARSFASMGSLADLIGFDDDEESKGSHSASSYNSAQSGTTYSSYTNTNTSYYTEPEKDARKRSRINGASTAGGTTLGLSIGLSSEAAIAPADASVFAVSSVKHKHSSKSKSNTQYDEESNTAGSESIISKFMDTFLRRLAVTVPAKSFL